MKRNLAGLAAVLAVAVLPMVLAADPLTEVWALVYNAAETTAQRYEIMQSIVELDNREFAPMLMQSLEELISTRAPETRSEQVIREKLIRMVIVELGELKTREAAGLIFRVVEETEDPYLRAEALVATGRVGAGEYADEIALLLRNLNLYRGKNIEGEETLAYGCIVALERLREPVGYVPVFLASHAGYSRRITDLAQWALRTIVDDPSDILADIIRDDGDHAVRLLALEQGLASSASAERKLDLCEIGLEQGLVNTPSDTAEAQALENLRMRAMGATVLLGVSSPRAIDLTGDVLDREADLNEWLTAIDVLRALGTDQESADAAAEILTAYLKDFNDLQDAGRNADVHQLRLIAATISALGGLGSRVALPELLRAEFMRSYSTALNKSAAGARAGIR